MKWATMVHIDYQAIQTIPEFFLKDEIPNLFYKLEYS